MLSFPGPSSVIHLPPPTPASQIRISKRRGSVENGLSYGLVLCISKCSRFGPFFPRYFKCHTFTSTNSSLTDQREVKVWRMVYLTVWCFVFQNVLHLLPFYSSFKCHTLTSPPSITDQREGEVWRIVYLAIWCFIFPVLRVSYIHLHPPQPY